MTSRIFKSIITVAVAILFCSLILIMGVLYGYANDLQTAMLKDELSVAAAGTEKAGLGEGVVADSCTWMTLGQVGCMSGNLIGYHTCAHIFLVRQGEVLLWCYIAEHGSAEPCYLGATDG